MIGQELTELEEFEHGDVIRIESFESNCGIDETTFVAIVIETKNSGMIAVPQDFRAWLYAANKKGVSWETEIEWLLGNFVEIILLERYE
ncbi:MAG: conjugal transfer protein TraF [Carnobacterium maltaromaticum]